MAVGIILLRIGSDGNWRAALGVAQRQIPGRLQDAGEFVTATQKAGRVSREAGEETSAED